MNKTTGLGSTARYVAHLHLCLGSSDLPGSSRIGGVSNILNIIHNNRRCRVIVNAGIPGICRRLYGLTNVDTDTTIGSSTTTIRSTTVAGQGLAPGRINGGVVNCLTNYVAPVVPILLTKNLFHTIGSVFNPSLLKLCALRDGLCVLFSFLCSTTFCFVPVLINCGTTGRLSIGNVLNSFVNDILVIPSFTTFTAGNRAFAIFNVPTAIAGCTRAILPIVLSIPLFYLVCGLIGGFVPSLLADIFAPFFDLVVSVPFVLYLLTPLNAVINGTVDNNLT